MKNKPLNRIVLIIIAFVGLAHYVHAQGGSKVVFIAGLPLHKDPMGEADIQVRRYWLFDSALSNNGPGLGCEINFGTNNSGITLGPKLFYQVDIYMGSIVKKHKSGVYALARLSVVRYTNSHGNDIRIAPEGGIAIFDEISLMYGYNFPVPFNGKNEIPGVFDSQFTLAITFGGKKK